MIDEENESESSKNSGSFTQDDEHVVNNKQSVKSNWSRVRKVVRFLIMLQKITTGPVKRKPSNASILQKYKARP